MAESILECRDVDKSVSAVRAVSGVSVLLRADEVLGLVGPNGAGKTTLVDLIAGERHPDSGTISAGGRALVGPPSRRARLNRLARTFQHPQVALDLTARENMLVGLTGCAFGSLGGMLRELVAGMFGAAARQFDPEVDRVATALGLHGIDRPCKKFTQEELRLVEVARALLMKPTVLLLDEMGTGLAPKIVAELVAIAVRKGRRWRYDVAGRAVDWSGVRSHRCGLCDAAGSGGR